NAGDNNRTQPHFPDAFRCCARQCIASDFAQLARDRSGRARNSLDNGNQRRCCARQRQIIAPKNHAAFRNRIFRSSIVQALQPACRMRMSILARAEEERSGLEPQSRAVARHLLQALEFRTALGKPFFSELAISLRLFSFSSSLKFLWPRISSLSASVSLPGFHSALATLRIRRLAFSLLSPSVSPKPRLVSFSCAAKFSVLVSGSEIRRSRANLPREPCALAAKNRIQFAAEEQKQTSEIHPRQQNDDRRQREISRLVAAVARHVELEQFRYRDPADREKNRAGQCLSNGEIIFRRE